VDNDNFDDFVVDSNRVRDGGQSSKAIAKAMKNEREKKQKTSGGEEE
jgi:hypothetical protein